MADLITEDRLAEINDLRQKSGLPAVTLESANEVLGKAPAGVDDSTLIVYTGDELVEAPPPEPPVPELKYPPVLSGLEPNSAEIGSADVTLTCVGENFTADSIIVFNGGDEPTTFVSASELTTGVKPSLAEVAIDVPVFIKNEIGESDPMTFSFTAPVEDDEEDTPTSTKRGKKRR